MKTKEEITLAIYYHGHQMARSYPNLTFFQPCSSYPQLPSFTAGQVLRFVRLITHAAPHSENGMLLTISFFICGSGIHATFRGDAYSRHSRDPGYSACEASLDLQLSPNWVGWQPSSLGPAAVPDDRGSSGVRCGLVCGSCQT